MVKLQQTLTALNSKTAFHQDQMNYYDTYIKTCLDNLNRKQVEQQFDNEKTSLLESKLVIFTLYVYRMCPGIHADP